MKTFKKLGLLSTTAAMMSLALANASYATSIEGPLNEFCPAGEVCKGLTLEINDDRVLNIEGLGGVDLSGVEIKGVETIAVEMPNPVQNAIEASQTNVGDITASTHYKGQFISGDFESATSAIANNLSVGLTGSNALEGAQKNTGEVSATADVEMLHLVDIDSIDISVTSVANNASVEGTNDSIVDFGQENLGREVVASLDSTFMGQAALGDADVDINVSAISNNLSISGDGLVSASLAQHNCADVTASAKVNMQAMRDPINVTAVGNNLSISRINVQ